LGKQNFKVGFKPTQTIIKKFLKNVKQFQKILTAKNFPARRGNFCCQTAQFIVQ
jgi:hypothetical protein